MFEINPRTWRLTKLTLAYLAIMIASILASVSAIYAIAVYISPWALLWLAGVAILAIPAWMLAKKRLSKLERIEAAVERELRRSN